LNALISLCVTSYNRYDKLKNCIESFFATNTYNPDNIELIIIDNGSDDTVTADYVRSLQPECRDYHYILNEKNDYPYCLRRAKNQARAMANGQYFIDCPDDHLFVVQSPWVSETINYLKASDKKISCICHYAYPKYRFYKPNNCMSECTDNSDYYVSELKGYADYHLMSRQAYKKIGVYREDLAWAPNAESDYMERSLELNYRRALLKYPVSIINEESYKLLLPIDYGHYKNAFSQQLYPVYNETLINYASQNGHICK